jgi:hypothetical protein
MVSRARVNTGKTYAGIMAGSPGRGVGDHLTCSKRRVRPCFVRLLFASEQKTDIDAENLVHFAETAWLLVVFASVLCAIARTFERDLQFVLTRPFVGPISQAPSA